MADKGDRAPADQFRTVVTADEIRLSVEALAEAITRDHPPGEPLVIVAVLTGGLVFLADLIRCLRMPLQIELVRARSYKGAEREPEVVVSDDVGRLRLAGRQVLLVDCILDSGQTLATVRRAVEAEGPADLRVCVLLSKHKSRAVAIEPDYVGLEISDVFVIGYGLDHEGRWRHLPFIAEAPAEYPGAPEQNVS